MLSRAEHVARGQLSRVTPVHRLRQVAPAVGDSLFEGRLQLRRQLAGVEGLTGADADPRETRHELRLGWMRWAELQKEIQDAEQLRRRLLLLHRQGLDECNLRRGRGSG